MVPKVKQPAGNKIYQTTIPDAGTKQFLGRLAGSGRYLISNPKFNSTSAQRQPLTLATSFGADRQDTTIGSATARMRTPTSSQIRGAVQTHAFGFSYPTAVEVDGKLIVAYSEKSKQNIWVSVVDIAALPKGAGECAVQDKDASLQAVGQAARLFIVVD